MIPTALYLVFCFLATGMCQGFAECRESYFRSNGECQPCPDHCVTCDSDTNCTKCTRNYYGATCQEPCPESDCECHKTYGFCTYGCPDGLFPEVDSPRCSPCPDNCNLCSSSSACVVCKPRFYGDTCTQRCSSNCEACNKTTGNCLVCEEGYFNQDGLCLICPEGCVSCYDIGNCSSCKEGYLKLNDAQCIENCSMLTNVSFPSHVEDHEAYTPYEVTTTACNCTKRSNGQSGKSSLLTKRPCIDYLTCPPKFLCPAVDEDSVQCSAIRTYTCTHSCRPVNESFCECRRNECNVVSRTPHTIYFCPTIKESFFVKDVSTTSECVPSVDKPDEDESLRPFSVFAIVLTVVGSPLLVMEAVLRIRYLRPKTRCMRMMWLHHYERTRRENIPKTDTTVSLDDIKDNLNNEESSDKCRVCGAKEHSQSRVKLTRSRSAPGIPICKSP